MPPLILRIGFLVTAHPITDTAIYLTALNVCERSRGSWRIKTGSGGTCAKNGHNSAVSLASSLCVCDLKNTKTFIFMEASNSPNIKDYKSVITMFCCDKTRRQSIFICTLKKRSANFFQSVEWGSRVHEQAVMTTNNINVEKMQL